MTGVEEGGGPDAAAALAQPGEGVADGGQYEGEAGQGPGPGGAIVVVGAEDDGVVPEGPEEAGEEGCFRQGVALGQGRGEVAAPADLLPQGGQAGVEDAQGGGKDGQYGQGGAGCEAPQAEGGGLGGDLSGLGKGGGSAQPAEGVGGEAVGQGDEVGEEQVARLWSLRAELGQGPLLSALGQDGAQGRGPGDGQPVELSGAAGGRGLEPGQQALDGEGD